MKVKFEKIKLKGHRSFYLRDGWINKGLMDVEAFNKKHSVDELGVGSTMVYAIRYYLFTMGLIGKKRVGRKVKYFLTEDFGEIINKHDKYLEDLFTLWILHYKFVSNIERATTFNLFFNEFDYNEFTKDEVNEFIEEYIKQVLPNKSFSNKSLNSDVNCIINNYNVSNVRNNLTPEENLISPFTELGLVREIDNSKDTIYEKSKPSLEDLPKEVILFIIYDLIDKGSRNISIDKLINGINSPTKVLNLDRYLLNQYLEKLESDNYIEVNRTAGLNQIYVNKEFDQASLLKHYYNYRNGE